MPNSFPVLSQPVHPALELAQRLQEQARAGHACSARTGRQLVVAELGFGSLSLCCWCWGSRHPQGYHQRVSPAAQQETHPKGRNSSFLKQDLCFYPGLWLQRAAASQAECLTKSGLHIWNKDISCSLKLPPRRPHSQQLSLPLPFPLWHPGCSSCPGWWLTLGNRVCSRNPRPDLHLGHFANLYIRTDCTSWPVWGRERKREGCFYLWLGPCCSLGWGVSAEFCG
jgi:hypothetical protein